MQTQKFDSRVEKLLNFLQCYAQSFGLRVSGIGSKHYYSIIMQPSNGKELPIWAYLRCSRMNVVYT